MLALPHGEISSDAALDLLRILLQQDAIGAWRNRRTGEDTDGFTWLTLPSKPWPAEDVPMTFSSAPGSGASSRRSA